MKRLQVTTVVALALTTANCATVTRGTTNQVQFVSEPPEAAVQTSLGHTCSTPCTIESSRKTEFVAVFEKPGYRRESVPVQTRVAGSGAAGFAGNVIIGGIVGMAADAATGATLEHYPNPVSVTLQAVGRPGRAPTRARRLPATSLLLDQHLGKVGFPPAS